MSFSVVCFFCFFFLMRRRPPRSTRTDTLFPYTTLFRSMATSRCASLGRITGAIEPRLPLDLRWRVQGYEPAKQPVQGNSRGRPVAAGLLRSEEHTSELQSLMRLSYAVFCLKKKNTHVYDAFYQIKFTYTTTTKYLQ